MQSMPALFSGDLALHPSPLDRPPLLPCCGHTGRRCARLVGASFASRVGISLLRNAGPSQTTLLVAGQREYEDLAVELVSTARGWNVLGKLRASLNSVELRGSHHSRADKEGNVAGRGRGMAGGEVRERLLPIFDTEAITKELNQAFMLMSDVHDTWKNQPRQAPGHGNTRLPHIVLTGRNINNLGLEQDCQLAMYACE